MNNNLTLNKKSTDKKNSLRINEIFYSIQGESSYTGHPCVFVRLTYCNLRCNWCDTEYSFYEGVWMSFEQIKNEIKQYECKLVEITGGEPLIQENVLPFMTLLCDDGFDVIIETGGHMNISKIDPRVKRIIDIKCIGSGEARKMMWSNIEHLNVNDQVKFVIKDRMDFDYAKEVIEKYELNKICTILMSPVFHEMDNLTLANWILEDKLDVRFQVQLHKYIWHPETRGV